MERAGGPWRLSEAFQSGPLKIRRRYLLAIGLQAMQQLSGINLLVYYFPHILTTNLGMSTETALQLAAGLSVTYFVFSLIPLFWLDRMSRRKPLIGGAFVCALCFLVAGILQSNPTDARVKASLAFFSCTRSSLALAGSPSPGCTPPRLCRFVTAPTRPPLPPPPTGSSTT